MAVGVGAHELRGDLGAPHRGHDDAEILQDERDVEAREVQDLEPCGIGEHRLQVGRVILPDRELHEMLVAAAVRKLHDAEPVAELVEAHRLAVHGDGTGCEHVCGQVALVEIRGQLSFPSRRRFARRDMMLRTSTRTEKAIAA